MVVTYVILIGVTGVKNLIPAGVFTAFWSQFVYATDAPLKAR